MAERYTPVSTSRYQSFVTYLTTGVRQDPGIIHWPLNFTTETQVRLWTLGQGVLPTALWTRPQLLLIGE